MIDLGPEGGGAGGELVAEGTPEAVARVKKSHTGQYLARVLERGSVAPKSERSPSAKLPTARARTARA